MKKIQVVFFISGKKVLEEALGDYIWIAESDDWCDNNFLEELIPAFINDATRISYSRTDFMNSDGSKKIWTIEDYISDLDREKWNYDFLETSSTLMKKYFSVKNIIPNASSAILKKPINLKLLNDEKWFSMKVCGDWLFYINIIKGGLVSYSTKTTKLL